MTTSVGFFERTSNPAFEDQTPMQVIERGEADRIWRMIFQIDSPSPFRSGHLSYSLYNGNCVENLFIHFGVTQ